MTGEDRTGQVACTRTDDGHSFYRGPGDADVFRQPTGPDGTARVRASGEFDMESVSGLVQALADARDEGATRVMLDLSGVTFGDSTFLNVLIRTHRSGELVLVGDSPRHLRKLFELTGTEHLFRHVRTS